MEGADSQASASERTVVEQPAARVHHVVWCVEPATLPALREYWERALGVPLVEFEVADLGISVIMSWDAGVEIIAPAAVPGELTASLWDLLAAKGPSVQALVFEVDDLDLAVKQAVDAGATVVYSELIEPDVLAGRMAWPPDRQKIQVRQALLNDHLGMSICLQESRPA
jgi:hypothetical protein